MIELKRFFTKTKIIRIILLILVLFSLKFINSSINLSAKYVALEDQIKLLISDDLNEDISLFDLKKELLPVELYDSIMCRKSAKIHVEGTLCVHNATTDVVSRSIWIRGSFETHLVQTYMDYLSKNPDWLALDIGANIGQFSLFAAKLGRDVVAVEPFYDNHLRIHKAAKSDYTTNRIKLITNAISNKRGEIKFLSIKPRNIGGQGLFQNKDKVFNESDIKIDDPKAKYYVKTILLDDIVAYLPLRDGKYKYKKAIMKIDIEGFEPLAFLHASKLFYAIDIPVIIMEWDYLARYTKFFTEIEHLLNFLYSRGYTPYKPLTSEKMKKDNWKKWPLDVVWKKEGY